MPKDENKPLPKKMPHSGLAHKIAREAMATGCIIMTFHRDDDGNFISETVTWFEKETLMNKDSLLRLFDKYFSNMENPYTVLRRNKMVPDKT